MTISGDALAAKLAELVAAAGFDPDGWGNWPRAEAGAVLCDLLAWVAEQGAASPMPATRRNNPVEARTGGDPTPEPSAASETVNRAHSARDDDPVPGDAVDFARMTMPLDCECGARFEVVGGATPIGGMSVSVRVVRPAPAPDAALRAALRTAAAALDDAAHELTKCGLPHYAEDARAVARSARAALSPDATGGDA